MTAKNNMKETASGKKRQDLQRAASIIREANRAAAKAAAVLAAQAAGPKPISKEEIEEIVANTVLKTLANLGIRAHTDEDVDELRKDFAYTRAWRKTVQSTTRTGWLTFVTVFATGFMGVLYIAARIFLTGHV